MRLTRLLDATDRFFGDARSSLSDPPPHWTAPAFDKCLLLALAYPLAAIFVVWAVSGYAGSVEQMLGLHGNVEGWRRAFSVLLLAAIWFAFSRFFRN